VAERRLGDRVVVVDSQEVPEQALLVVVAAGQASRKLLGE